MLNAMITKNNAMTFLMTRCGMSFPRISEKKSYMPPTIASMMRYHFFLFLYIYPSHMLRRISAILAIYAPPILEVGVICNMLVRSMFIVRMIARIKEFFSIQKTK